MSVEPWTFKYLPKELSDYVWRDPLLQQKANEWLGEGALPHLILSGKSGLGKSALAKLLLRLLGVPKGDILELNASRERKIDDLQDRITTFCSTYTMIDNQHGIKYVLLEEADAMSLLAQKFLRAELESNIGHVRFIFTCNYQEKIETAIRGRCQHFHFEALDLEEFVQRLMFILDSEKVSYKQDELIEFIEATYPDLRKCINTVQQSTVGNVLQPMSKAEAKGFDYLLEVSGLFKKGQHKQARELLVANAPLEEYPDLYRFLYQNLNLWGSTNDQQEDALLIIRDAVYRDQIVADREINMAACIVELGRIARK
jgi:DNA polymerase III delta prime subunit